MLASRGDSMGLLPVINAGLVFWHAAMASPCDNLVISVEFDESLAAAETAYGDLDLDGFKTALATVEAGIPCVFFGISTTSAARWHRIRGLKAFTDRDIDRAKLEFTAARRLDPGYEFPESLVEPGHVVRDLFQQPTVDVTFVAAPSLEDAFLTFDGERDKRPVDWAAITQVGIGEGGEVVDSLLLNPSDPLPSLKEYLPLGKTNKGVRIGLGAGAGAAAVIAGVLYGAATAKAAKFAAYDPSLQNGDLEAAQKSTNNMVYASIGLSSGAVGLGVAALAVK